MSTLLTCSGITPNIMSPDQLWHGDGRVGSYAGTPTEFRRESIRSSLSMMKQKIFGTGAGMGRSCTSIDRPKDEFWDGMTNPALATSKEDITDSNDSGKVAAFIIRNIFQVFHRKIFLSALYSNIFKCFIIKYFSRPTCSSETRLLH